MSRTGILKENSIFLEGCRTNIKDSVKLIVNRYMLFTGIELS